MKISSSNNTDHEVSKDSNSEQLIEKIPIDETPFTAVKYDDKWFLTLGRYRLTEPLPSLDAVKEDAQRADWWRVMQIIKLMIDENKQHN